MYPSHYTFVRTNHVRFARGYERKVELFLSPTCKLVLPPAKFVLDAVDAYNLAIFSVMDEFLPKSRSEVERIISTGCLNKYVRVQKKENLAHCHCYDLPISSDAAYFSKVCPYRPVNP